MRKKNIIFVALNNEQFINEMLVSIDSLLKFALHNVNQYRIILYTNQPELVSNYKTSYRDIEIIEVTKEMINTWFVSNNYIYNIKICALIDCLERYNEPTLLIDTDTFFLKDVSELFERLEQNNHFIMNYMENSVGQIASYEKQGMMIKFVL